MHDDSVLGPAVLETIVTDAGPRRQILSVRKTIADHDSASRSTGPSEQPAEPFPSIVRGGRRALLYIRAPAPGLCPPPRTRSKFRSPRPRRRGPDAGQATSKAE